MIVLITIATCSKQYIVITVHSNMTYFVDEKIVIKHYATIVHWYFL